MNLAEHAPNSKPEMRIDRLRDANAKLFAALEAVLPLVPVCAETEDWEGGRRAQRERVAAVIAQARNALEFAKGGQ